MTEIEKIKKEINDINDTYLKNAIYIIQDYNSENKTRDDYKGRQIFELLQNADDCYTSEITDIVVKIQLKGNYLIFQNTGSPFNARGITSLMHPDASSKYKDTIGCKGLGFRSVLNWSKDIFIVTNEFVVNFNEEKAVDKLEYYKKNTDKTHIEELENLERIAILSSAEIVEDRDSLNEYLSNGFSTAVILKCNENVIPSIQAELCELQFEELLFLNHVREIHIESPEANREIESIKEKEDYLIQENNACTQWKVWKKEGTINITNGKLRKYELAIAYNSEESSREYLRNNGVLYSYFKTEIPMPFPFLIHGTFDLTSERNNLDKDNEANKVLLGYLIDFIIEKGVEIATSDNFSSYEPLRFLLPNKEIFILDNTYNFTNTLKEKIKKYKILPSIDGSYLSFEEAPKFDTLNFAGICKKERFHNLLQFTEDAKIIDYIKENKVGFYEDVVFTDLINRDADFYVDNNLATNLIILYNERYAYSKIGPNILFDTDGNRVTDRRKKVFNNPTEYFSLPSWSSLSFINKELEERLCAEWNCNARGLTNKLDKFGCDEYSFDRVLRELVNQSKDDKLRTNELLVWLYNYWNNNGQKFDSSLGNIEVRVVDRGGTIIKASQCFLGKEYGNNIGQTILEKIEGACFLASIEEIGIDAEKDSFISFLGALNVSKYPRIVKKEITDLQERTRYSKYNTIRHSTLYTNYNEPYSHNDFFSQGGKIIVSTIDNLDVILRDCKFEDIVCWILSDQNLYNHLSNDDEIDSDSCMIGRPPKKIDSRRVGFSQMRSYLRRIFVETAWIDAMNGMKVNVGSCTLSSHNLSPIIEVLNVDYDYINRVFGRNYKKDVELLFSKLGMADDITELSKQKIYDILLGLPEIDSDCSIGKKIYTQLNLSFNADAVNKLITDNASYEKFKKDGKVLAEYKKTFSYIENKQVYYVDRKIYSDDVLELYPRLALNKRAGDSKIKLMFAVKSIKEIGNVEVSEEIPHVLNEQYQNEFKKMLPYIYAKRLGIDKTGKELSILKRSNVILVSSAKTSYSINDEKITGVLSDYEVIYLDRYAYIKIPDYINSLDDLKKEIKFISSMAEIVTTMIDVDSDKDSFMNIIRCNSISDIEEYYKQNGDDDLSLVRLAKEKFNQKINNEEEFINALIQATNKNKAEIEASLQNYSIDYLDINAKNNIDSIIELFKVLDIDVFDYNKFAYQNINLVDYYKIRFHDLKNELKGKYYHYKLRNIIDNNGEMADFETVKNAYNYSDVSFKNSITVDVNKIYQDIFGVLIEDLSNEADDYSTLLDSLKVDVPEDVTETEEDSHESENKTPQKEKIDFAELNAGIENATSGEVISPDLTTIKEKEPGNHGGGKGGSYRSENNDVKELVGFIAESKVFNTLKKRSNIELEWLSGNAEKAKIISEGNDSLGYDIRFVDEDGPHYIEVKGSKSTNIEFNLTKNEYDFALKHKDEFEIWFVFVHEDKTSSEPYILGNILVFENGENFFNNNKFSVEQSEFKIRAKIKKTNE